MNKRVERLKELFPECLTSAGEIDFDLLKETITGKITGVPFSYRPYSVCGKEEEKKIYIVRLEPRENSVSLDWLGNEDGYTVQIKKDGNEVKSVSVTEHTAFIDGLEMQTEYTVCVRSANNESRERLFTTGNFLGKVINYLDPNDEQYAFSGHYLASPSIARYKGYLYVSMDVFKGFEQQGGTNLTLIFRSGDDGKTWEYVTDLVPSFWGRLFVAQGKLCILSNSDEVGSIIISSSDDGVSWRTRTELFYAFGDLYHNKGGSWIHTTPTPVAEMNGKLFVGFRCNDREGDGNSVVYATCDLSKSVTDANAWTLSRPLRIEHEWLYKEKQSRYAEEANAVEYNGEIYFLYRYAYKKALVCKANLENPKSAPVFHKVVDMPVGWCKFYIVKNDDGYYYAMGNHICYPRSKILLIRSQDLEKWEIVRELEDISALDPEKNGVQYPSIVLEDGKLKTVLRIALNGSHTFHDSNAIVFKTYEINE